MHTRVPWGTRREQSFHRNARRGQEGSQAPHRPSAHMGSGSRRRVSGTPAQEQAEGREMERSLSHVVAFFAEQPQVSKGSGP